MKIILNPKSDPVWEEVGRVDHDFTSHWNGMYIHYYTTIQPLNSESETKNFIERCCKEIASYLNLNKCEFSKKDRFQIVVGWPESVRSAGRQIVKTGGTWDDIEELAAGKFMMKFYPGWSNNVFDSDE